MATNADGISPSPALRPRPQPLPGTLTRASPVLREDCWSEDATHALIEAWGSHHLALNRGNLRQHQWLEVAAAVNSAGYRRRRTDIQCKNRIDTLKKKYKIEKSKTVDSSGGYVSPWPFFSRLDFLISGDGEKPLSSGRKISPDTPSTTTALTKFPVAPRSALKRKRPVPVDDSFFRQQFAAVIAAAAEVEAHESSEERERESSERTGTSSDSGGRERRDSRVEDEGFNNGCRQLAEAIMRFGEVYERVETVKQEQLIDLEKHRMQFTKDLEYQRMKLLMDTQLQLARIKRSKHSDDAVTCSLCTKKKEKRCKSVLILHVLGYNANLLKTGKSVFLVHTAGDLQQNSDKFKDTNLVFRRRIAA
ncbi:trihelix transcription factor ASIL2-like isoform X1 [Chenopodium quinoa]|uniref:trihelix transcription factor ASIL2-like isoform X1 n=1 Tax=Chenopodium quinoa TaxID=63459 RepID=UPI000B77EE1B|nr:trihelix transcription factor ASIL2-like isoform X1 [Chenopodium quinoa]